MFDALQQYLKFAYGSFLKPHTGDGSGSQQDALESFYSYQADAYDTTRTTLLRGRNEMIRLVAAQLKYKHFDRRPIWVDIGGGTGWNIEQMGQIVDIPTFFSAVYLVDLTPSLLKVAKARFEKLGWTNVKVVCMDCRYFSLADLQSSENKGQPSDGKADLITMSYSLTMIPDFFPVIDMTTSLLADDGIFGIVDFYAQTEVEFMLRDYVGGFLDRHCTWLNRTFWKTWFEQDRVMFDGGRRDYLEYRFGTRMSINKRNAMLPGLRIPFYIWIGCKRDHPLMQSSESVVQASFSPAPEGLKRPDVPFPSVYYQNHHRRTYYQDSLQRSRTEEYTMPDFDGEEISEIVHRIALTSRDVVLAPTGSGDLILALLLQSPRAIHAFDHNAARNHLLELNLATHQNLQPDELHKFYEQDEISQFRDILIDRLSPSMSSQAVQYWLNHGSRGWLSNSKPNPRLRQPAGIQLKDYSTLGSLTTYEGLQIHTTKLGDLLQRTNRSALTVIILPDSMDQGDSETEASLRELSGVLSTGGKVLLKSANEKPWQIDVLEHSGFETARVESSIWICTKTGDAH